MTATVGYLDTSLSAPYPMVCSRCGAFVAPALVDAHDSFHQAQGLPVLVRADLPVSP